MRQMLPLLPMLPLTPKQLICEKVALALCHLQSEILNKETVLMVAYLF